MIFIVFLVPDRKVAWVNFASANIPDSIYWPFLIFDSKKLGRKRTEQRLAATTGVVVASRVCTINYFISLFVLSIMNVETIDAE
jgi:hypothetical protein